MAYDPGALEAALAAAVGATPERVDDLRIAFFESAHAHVAAMRAAETSDAWQAAAAKLRSLAASFSAYRIIDAASAAEHAPMHDRKSLTRIERSLASLAIGF